MKAKEHYKAAVYLRLSRDDEERGGARQESNSIGSQREMIRSYIRQQGNMEIYDVYVDDGYSGVNFDRPEFQRMMKDIRAGNVDCVIVKDLSRLGRDYIEAGRLIQKTFPAFCVRFIALTDHFDSLTADNNERSMVVPVKNFVNDFYARDISDKVRSHLKVKRERGDFIGAFAAYGYQKSKDDRNRLVPDDYAAGIVKKIFAWKIDGYSNLAISGMLDAAGILSPMEYKRVRGEKYHTGFVSGAQAKWSAVAVKRILINETYTGTLVQGKEEKVSYKIKKSVRKPEEEWVRVENAHEAIIPWEDYQVVQELLQTDTRAGGGEKKAHRYAGLLFCGDCMEPMIRRVMRCRGKESVAYICSKKNRGEGCTRHTISGEALDGLVLAGIRQQVALFADKRRIAASLEQMEIDFAEVTAFEREIQRLHREKDKYLELRAGLYEDLKRQIITEEDFRSFCDIYEKKYRELEEAAARQEETVKKLFRSGVTAGVHLERMKNVMQVTEPDRVTLVSFVKRILVYEDKRVYVEFRHKELFSGGVMPAGYAGAQRDGRCRGEKV